MNYLERTLLSVLSDEPAFYEKCAQLLGLKNYREMDHHIAGWATHTFQRFLRILELLDIDQDKLPFPHSQWRRNGAMTPREYCGGLHRFLTGKTVEKWRWAEKFSGWNVGAPNVPPSDEEILAMGEEEFFAYMGLAEVHGDMGLGPIRNYGPYPPSLEELHVRHRVRVVRTEYRDRRSWCITRRIDLDAFGIRDIRGFMYTILF